MHPILYNGKCRERGDLVHPILRKGKCRERGDLVHPIRTGLTKKKSKKLSKQTKNKEVKYRDSAAGIHSLPKETRNNLVNIVNCFIHSRRQSFSSPMCLDWL